VEKDENQNAKRKKANTRLLKLEHKDGIVFREFKAYAYQPIMEELIIYRTGEQVETRQKASASPLLRVLSVSN